MHWSKPSARGRNPVNHALNVNPRGPHLLVNNMKIIFVIFAAILFILSGFAAKAENGDKHPAKMAVRRLLYRHSVDGMSLNQLVDRDCKELGVSRDEILSLIHI